MLDQRGCERFTGIGAHWQAVDDDFDGGPALYGSVNSHRLAHETVEMLETGGGHDIKLVSRFSGHRQRDKTRERGA